MSLYAERLNDLRQGVVAAGFFKEELHPRARDGKFIRKGGWVRGLLTRLVGGKHEASDGVGKVTGFAPNQHDRRNPWVLITTKNGPAAARVSDIVEAAQPKGVLSVDKGGVPWRREALSAEERHKLDQKRLVEQIARANTLAETLSETDPVERVKVLDKIMGGVRGTPLSTAYINNKRGVTGDEWDLARMNQHEAIWRRILTAVEQAGVPKDKQALLLGGQPGSGKSTAMLPGEPAGKLGVVGWNGLGPMPDGVTHFVLDPDTIKAMMIEAGMLPDGINPKIKPFEQVSFIHAESNFLTAMFFRRFSELSYNVAYDTTMANTPHVKKNVGPLHDAGYTFKGVFIDVPREESRLSTMRRYLQDWQRPEGARFVPSEAGAGSPNKAVFEDMTQWMNEWIIIDNTGIGQDPPNPAKRVVAQGTEPIKRPPPPKYQNAAFDFMPKKQGSTVTTNLEPGKPGVYIPGRGIVTAAADLFPPTLGTDWQLETAIRQGKPELALEMLQGSWPWPSGIDDSDDESWAAKTSLYNDLYASGRYDLAPEFDAAFLSAF